MVFCIGFLTALAGYILESWPRWRVRYFGIDTWRHLMVADKIRTEKRLPKSLPDKYLLPEESDYPPLFRVILAFFPKKWLEEWQGFVSPLFDFLHSLFLYFFVYSLTHNMVIAVTAQVAYVANPLVVMENSNLTTRPIASLLFSLAFVPLIYYAAYGGAWMLILSLAGLTALILTHRFALQALVALSVAFALVQRSWVCPAMVAASIVLAIAVTKGFYAKVLWGHIQMLNWWRLNIHNRYAHQVRGLMKKGEKSPDIVFRLYQFVFNFPPVAVLAAIPCSVIAVLAVVWYFFGWVLADFSRTGVPSEIFESLGLWVSALLVTGILIRSIKYVEWAGEGERYMEFGAFPTAILTSLFVWNVYRAWTSPWVFVLFGAFILVSGLLPALFLQKKVILDSKDRSIGEDLRNCFAFINDEIKGEVRMATIPLGLADSVMYFTHAAVFSTDSSLAHYNHYSDFFPVIRKPLNEIFKTYQVNYLFLNQNYAKLEELPLKGAKELYRSGPYTIYKVDSAAETPSGEKESLAGDRKPSESEKQ